jgi:ABC-type dipeptide/oligopeptide/nickel transport system permease component
MAPGRKPKLILVPIRALIVTLLVTLLAFAISLLLGIIGSVIFSHATGRPVSMAIAYRAIALPAAIAVACVMLVISLTMEIRQYRRNLRNAE